MNNSWDSYNVQFKVGNETTTVVKEQPIRRALAAYVKALHEGLPVFITNVSIGSKLSDKEVERTLKTLLTTGHFKSLEVN